ncbi:hypothetical protein ABB37_00795 [Leptomonas pyrrhocoris]|uniref:Uncharacterized protein n=1 Tax=Leptomonas pyrrhocoris TaxID=157538 RepID=A0A0N0VHV6_LEPPY|nr:hypothetical protein ABB37_00795 [Leptomonas pyrrhocoris]KPA86701.1 hypothetical protein ABB37_00795 [Leptomonas pyrrhocoris]|eukprot:XP_015665140.1 hypothetical protein ABB37_00795 [Leptomonas pyrrhocoris]
MDQKCTYCFLDIGPVMTTVTTSSANEVHTWEVATPASVGAASVNMEALLVNGCGVAVVDALLRRIAKSAHLATVGHIVLLSRHDTAHDVFYRYVLRWLHGACPSSTPVSVMPLPLYAARLAGVESAVVVECHEGVVMCTPVLEGVVASDAVAHWGDVREATASDALRSLPECWRHVSRAVMTAMSAAARLLDDSEQNSRSGTPFPHSSDDVHKNEVDRRLIDAIPFVYEMEQHLRICRRRELDACLSTVVLYGDVATVVEARYCLGLLLSMFLPDSLVTWC